MIVAGFSFHDLNFIQVLYIIAFGLFIYGLMGLTGPKTAVRGNRIAAVGMGFALLGTLLACGAWSLFAPQPSNTVSATIAFSAPGPRLPLAPNRIPDSMITSSRFRDSATCASSPRPQALHAESARLRVCMNSA